MYCSTCGNKLDDNAAFCSVCGTKVVREASAPAPSATPAPAPVEEKKEEAPVVAPTPVVEEKKEEAPAPAVEVKKEETPAPAPAPVEEKKEEAPAPTPVAAPTPAPAPAPAAAPTPAPAPAPKANAKADKKAKNADKPKKKGKGCLIAVIVVLVIGILLFLLAAIIAVVLIFVVPKVTGRTPSTPSILSSFGSNDDAYDGISDYYGSYHGTSKVDSTSGAAGLVAYLSSKGVTVNEEDLYTDETEEEFALAIYDDSTGDTTPAAWDLIVYMGDFFDYQRLNNKDFVTYADWGDENKRSSGDLIPDETRAFKIEVTDDDFEGNLSKDLFGVADDTGKYQITMEGYFDENGTVHGTITISLLYEGMEDPFTEKISFEASK